ncbi:uncharacterized protein LOC122180264 [Lagopus leucura]|uniref:uncharacterized protein LOC122180264 n=1 Tax=Lagopus leucura TaxID=30410 RepID=UPI001C672A5D|nr:uncharacterized protein LOC122180264 [Lagopus leucura]
MSRSGRAASGAAASSPFWEMLTLLAQEPGVEWLKLGLSGQAAVASPCRTGQRTACRTQAAGRCGELGAAAGREADSSWKHSLGPQPLKTLLLLECSGDVRLWQAYLEGLKKFLAFRKVMEMPAAWPIPEDQVRGFLAVESLYSSSKTLVYVAALSYLSRLSGNSDPLEDAITRWMVMGLRCQVGILREKYAPITIEVLRSLLGALESVCVSRYECLLFRALFTVAFFGALRIREVVAKHRNVLQPELLYLRDMQVTEGRVVFRLRNSPVDRERPIISLALSGEPWVCPVLALRSFVAVRSRLEGPLFVHRDNVPVTKRDFLTVLRWTLRLLGLPLEQYGVHSFWLGTIITAARCGYPREDVTRLARWPCVFPDKS